MAKKLIVVVLLSLGLCVSCNRGEAAGDPIVGTWELVRADGVPRRDIPPGGFPNFLVEFNDEGGVRSGLPGQLDSEDFRSYSIENGQLNAWLRLSNDQDTPREFSFLAESWLEIDLPTTDGFVALFRRVEDTSGVRPKCAAFTIAGEVEPQVVQEEKQALMAFVPGQVPPSLRSRWTATLGDEGEERRLELTLGVDSARLTIQAMAFPELPPSTVEGAARASEEYLRTDVLSCGALMNFAVEGDTLTLTARGTEGLVLERME